MIQTKIINRIDFPKIEMQDDLLKIAEKIIIPDIIAGIKTRKAIDGGALPRNEPETVKRKGKDTPLIDTGDLVNSFIFRPQGKYKVKITITSNRKKIGGYLQIDGIWTKTQGIKYYRFFGISKDAHDRAMQYAYNRIKEITGGSRSGG